MSRRVQLIDINKLKNTLLTAAKAYIQEDFIPEVVVPEVQELVQQLFDKTTQHWEGGSGAPPGSSRTRKEPNKPVLRFDVEETRFGVNITAYVESYIWNLLDQGRDERVTTKKEVFVPRSDKGTSNGQRTIPGTLDVSADRSYKDIVIVPAGTTIKGLKPRKWSEIIGEEVEKQLGAKYPTLKFTFTVKET